MARFAAPARSLSLAVVIAAICATTVRAITADVRIDAANVRATMSPLAIGLHTSPYYNNMSHANVPSRLAEAGVTTLRYGGGGYADVFHWSITRAASQNGITGGGLSPFWGQPANFGYVGAGSDFASFVRLLDKIDNSHAVVTVNYGSAMKLVNGQSAVPDFGGQPKEAAAWVAYANAEPAIYGTPNDIPIGVDQQGNDWKTAGYWAKLRASTPAEYQAWATADGVYEPLNAFLAIDRDAPVGIKYWEMGNETFGTGYYNTGTNGYSVNYDVPYPHTATQRFGNPALSPARYGQEVAEYSQLMKSIDPTIKIGAVLSTPPDDWSWDYYPKTPGAINNSDNHWNPQVLAQAANHIDFVMVHWYPWPGAAGNNFGDALVAFPRDKIPTMIDGSGNHTGANAGLRDWLTQYGIPDAEIMITEFRYFNPENINAAYRPAADAIFVADSYATWLERGVRSVQFLEMLTDKNFLTDNSSLTRGSSFYAVAMMDKLAKPGDQFVHATSSNNDVRVHAALQADGSVAVMLLNLHRSESADVTITIGGASLDSDGTRYLLLDGINLSQSAANGLGNEFSASLPARSIATFIIPALAVPPGDYNSDGTVDAADYVLWRKTLGQTGANLAADGNRDGQVDNEDYELWRANFGQTMYGVGSIPMLHGPVSLPEPAASALILTLLIINPRIPPRKQPAS